MSTTATLSIDATITERGQTTVPAPIRRILGVQKGVVTFKSLPNGTVVIEPKSTDEHVDPAIGAFLSLIEADIRAGNVQPLRQSMLDDIDSLIGDLDVDMDAPLSDD